MDIKSWKDIDWIQMLGQIISRKLMFSIKDTFGVD